MWERTLSQKLVRLFCEQKVVDESKADAYVYGYELLISSVVSILLVILISIICGDVRYSLSFLIGFIPQRIYIGGYHATSHTRCYLAFTGLALICILLSKVIAANNLFRIITTVALLGMPVRLNILQKSFHINKNNIYSFWRNTMKSVKHLWASLLIVMAFVIICPTALAATGNSSQTHSKNPVDAYPNSTVGVIHFYIDDGKLIVYDPDERTSVRGDTGTATIYWTIPGQVFWSIYFN